MFISMLSLLITSTEDVGEVGGFMDTFAGLFGVLSVRIFGVVVIWWLILLGVLEMGSA